MDADISDLRFSAGLVLVMVLFLAYYILEVCRNPRSEEWYDELAWEGKESDGVLFNYPYCSLIVGVGGLAGLIVSLNPPVFVYTVLKVALTAAVASGSLDLRVRSGFRFRGRLFRVGSSTSAKQSVLEGMSAGKPETGKRTNRPGNFSSD